MDGLGDLVGKFAEAVGLIVDPFTIIVAIVFAAIGNRVPSKCSTLVKGAACALTFAVFFLWMQLLVFPYPPNAEPSKWYIAGIRYTEAGELLASDSSFRNYYGPRLNSELVYAAGGDPQNVWKGWSIVISEILGKILIVVSALSLGWLFSPKKS